MEKNTNPDVFIKLTTQPVGPLITKLAIPTVISMMVTAVYNTADTYFVSHIDNGPEGASISGAVGIIFSIMAIFQAVGFTIGMGSGASTSRQIGAKNLEKANEFCSTAIFCALTIGILISVLGLVFNDWIVIHSGATETIVPYAKAYARYIFIGAPFIVTSFVLNNQLRFQGRAFLSMIALASGGILNIFLDPLFIFVFKMGISGAAIATLISQVVSFSILLSMFIRKKSTTTLSVKFISKSFKTYSTILAVGFPSFCRQGIGALAMIFLNRACGVYSDEAVAAMSITNRIMMFVMSIAIGLGQGFQPVAAMNYGAKKFDRVKKATFFTLKAIFLMMSICCALILVFAPQIIKLFRTDADVIAIGKNALRFQAIPLPFAAAIFTTNMLLQTTGKEKSATFLSCLRQGIYFLPLILILPRFWGILGIEITQAVSDFLTAMTSIPFAIMFFKNLSNPTDKACTHSPA